MAKLPKYTLTRDAKRDDWILKRDGDDQAAQRFPTKEDATKGGVLKKPLDRKVVPSRSRRSGEDIKRSEPIPEAKIPGNRLASQP